MLFFLSISCLTPTTTHPYDVDNDGDGYTEFEDGTKVESIENRFVTFPSNLHHGGTTCTDQKRRVVINLNYFDSND